MPKFKRGQLVQDAHGDVHTVAYQRDGAVWVLGRMLPLVARALTLLF